MPTRGLALLVTFALAFPGCASAPRTPATPAGYETNIDFGRPDWAPFAAYFKQVITSIQQQWYRILDESQVTPARGAQVVIQFKLNSSGDTEILNVEDRGCGKLGVRAAIAAMDAIGPHPKWTDEMVAQLGAEQILTFSFTYQ